MKKVKNIKRKKKRRVGETRVDSTFDLKNRNSAENQCIADTKFQYKISAVIVTVSRVSCNHQKNGRLNFGISASELFSVFVFRILSVRPNNNKRRRRRPTFDQL
jgi:hypothetical protein